ncbi:post-GPI attachment to proteins factor 3-like [Watersipora subatra]|uniref:post-GPI attachment to proteins factor 3-like n=1 Tax=Watersipora subatra TaxID=2589382 RepID=UPI00355BB1A4
MVGCRYFHPVHLLTYLLIISATYASQGDRSPAHTQCLRHCHDNICKHDPPPSGILKNPKFNMLVWDCESECEYSCMWKTVTLFQMHDYAIPQFHGKWPFARVGGIQEPASMFFSLLNAAAHLYSIVQFRKLVPSIAPMYWTWHGYFSVALNAWFWSTIFHTRDFLFTQHMDYISAAGLVTYQLYAYFARVLIYRHTFYTRAIAFVTAFLFFLHSYYMLFVHFDFGLHVRVSVFIGILNALAWFSWSAYVWTKQPYVWKACLTLMLLFLCVALELLDFAPIAWVFDAHSLWHAGTAPLTLLWYSFIVDDCNYMLKSGRQAS